MGAKISRALSILIGYFLLSLVIVNVVLFYLALLKKTDTLIASKEFIFIWTLVFDRGGNMLIYLGLIALAGAYLIKDNKK